MTIGIGLSCEEGIVLAADTQLTVEGFFKDNETKFRELSFDQQGSIVATYAGSPSLMNIAYHEINQRVFYSGKNPAWKDVDKTIGSICLKSASNIQRK